METAVTSKSAQPLPRRVLRRVGSALFWASILLLGAFGIVFSFTNYPWFGATVVILILLLLGYSEQKRRTAQRARDAARMRKRPRP